MVPLCRGTFFTLKTAIILDVFYLNKEITAFISRSWKFSWKLTSALQLQTIANISETDRLRTLGIVPLCRGTLFTLKTDLILVVFYLNKEITAFISRSWKFSWKLTSALQLQTIANISETNRLRTLGMVPLCRGTFFTLKTVLILVVFCLNQETTAFTSRSVKFFLKID